MSAETVLSLKNVRKRYGAVTVTDDVSFTVDRGDRVALIGPNGAGKTTLFNLIAGRTPVSSGSIELNGRDITTSREEVRCRAGIGRTFQHSELFASLDATGNVLMALRRRHGISRSIIPSRKREARLTVEAHEFLDAVGLDPRGSSRVSDLSHGQRRQLEVAMALALEPDLLLFDEPTAGMSGAETRTFSELVSNLPRSLAMILIEHDLDVVFALADKVIVLAAGAVIAEGEPSTIRGSAEVQDAYLGTNLGEVFL
ncbi:MAG: ABC transporter ATP-binding protein [Nocardioides sp.]|nr:ABC transporter ATP-binding protein [Nocardioides sp.]